MGFKGVVPFVMGSLFVAGCYTGGEAIDAVDEIEAMRNLHTNTIRWNNIRWNDLVWNNIRWNNIRWNAVRMNNIRWNNIRWNNIRWNGVEWPSTALEGSSLVISRNVDGLWQRRGGLDLIGMEIDLEVDVLDAQGQPGRRDFVIHVDDIHVDDTWDDVYYYELSIGLKGSNERQPLCAEDNAAIPLRHYWDEQTGDRIDDDEVITFACTSGVLAHCVQWGYRPWAEAKRCDKWNKDKQHKDDCEQVALADYHQACTRMARADYCGTGEAWTVPGTPIDIYDHLFEQIEAPETDWPVEAEWTPDGAYCLDDIRQQAWKAEGKYPHCGGGAAKKVKDCGSLKDHRALLSSKYEDD